MKKFSFLFFIVLVVSSCKSDRKKDNNTLGKTNDTTISEKIAHAYGFENWNRVTLIEFTFNVDKDSTHYERSWCWNPKTNDVTAMSKKDTIQYNRNHVDSLTINTDRGFINDKYWLLAPFQLLWDKGASMSEAIKESAPISKKIINKSTLTYPNNGGYTPGDAYDFYFDDNYLIKEWVYRKGNQKEPSLISSWENQQDFNGIKLALDHNKAEGKWKLYFTNVKISTN